MLHVEALHAPKRARLASRRHEYGRSYPHRAIDSLESCCARNRRSVWAKSRVSGTHAKSSRRRRSPPADLGTQCQRFSWASPRRQLGVGTEGRSDEVLAEAEILGACFSDERASCGAERRQKTASPLSTSSSLRSIELNPALVHRDVPELLLRSRDRAGPEPRFRSGDQGLRI